MEIVELNNGLRVVNAASGHPYNMEDGTVVPPSGFTLNATRAETPVEDSAIPEGISAVKTEMLPEDAGLEFIKTVPEGVLVIGSIAAAQAYGKPVIALMANAATSARGTPPADKKMDTTKIIAFW
tara:strand:+ start:603 stop:977 length:375 start_codon:yes stop_codon:yes gene_type:complete